MSQRLFTRHQLKTRHSSPYKMKLVACLIVLTTVYLYAAGDSCPLGWEQFRDSCYSVGAETVSWIDAQSYCKLDGGYLVEIDDSTENTWLINVMKGKSLTVVWTGGSERSHKGSWEWATSKTPFGRYHDWFGTEPNGEGDDCLVLNSGMSYRWDDTSCILAYRFICEIKANSTA